MNVKILRVLMWGTIVAAVASAMLLAADDDGLPQFGAAMATQSLVSGA
jgi:hypothetical protein